LGEPAQDRGRLEGTLATRQTGVCSAELRGGTDHPPHPVARLQAPAQHVDLLVLAGASGRTLAWGPGHLDDSSPPDGDGNIVLSAHRDTHFRFLRNLRAGDRLTLELADGLQRTYRVRDMKVVDASALRIPRDTALPTLTLVTCYPFDAIAAGGPLRYVVSAVIDGDAGEPSLATIGT